MLLFVVILISVFVASVWMPWGPGTHLDFAISLLRNKNHRLPKDVLRLLKTHEEDFLYGNIAADIINFKAFGGPKHNCHQWDVIDRMEKLATTPGQKAFIMGFLTHLAADTVAHNHFIPYHLARYAKTQSAGHVYWEMAADRYVPESRWKIIDRLKNNPDLESNDLLIDAAVKKKAFSIKTNKLVFNHILLASSRDRWRNTTQKLNKKDMARLPKSRLNKFKSAALDRMVASLQKDGIKKLQHLDPSGKDAQKKSMSAKRSLIARFLTRYQFEKQAEEIAKNFLQGMNKLAG